MFNARASVWNLGEIAASKFLLFLKAERTMVRRDDLQMIPLEAVPELLLMPFFAKRRRKNIFRAFKIRYVKVFN